MKKAIWLVSGGPMQCVVAKAIKEKGYDLILSDMNPNAPCSVYANMFFELDTFDVDGHLLASEEALTKFDIKAVLTYAADCHYTVACLAKKLNLHGIDPKISAICQNKSLTRKTLSSNGVLQPICFESSNLDDVNNFISCNKQKLFVLKAPDSSGSRGFQKIAQDTLVTYEQYEYTKSFSKSGQVILEELLIPCSEGISEASVETLWVNGKMYWLNWVDRIFSIDQKYYPALNYDNLLEGIEIGHINPSSRPYSDKIVVKSQIEKAGMALGLHLQKGAHILKADIYFSFDGPVILELTPRTSGGWDSSGSSLLRGANIPNGIIHISLGNDITLDNWHEYFHYQDEQRIAVVLTHIEQDAKNCLARKFSINSGYENTNDIIESNLKQIEEKKFNVPVL